MQYQGRKLRTVGAVVIAVLLGSAGAVARAQFQTVTCKNAFTRQQEIAEGDKVVAEVYRTMPVLPDSDPVTQFVQRLGARLVAAAPLTPGLDQQWPFNFHVVASDEINAFALPGGTMFVNLGAIQAAETEAQLAGIMAHEMSHVILRHSTCNLTRQQKRSFLYTLGAIGSEIALGGAGGALAAQGFGMAQNLDFLHMSRGDEKQADLLGVRIAHDAGFDPRGLAQFFEIIEARQGRGGTQFLSDHPNPGNRTEYLEREIALLPPLEHPIKSTPAFAAVHQIAAGEHALTASEVKAGSWKSSGLYASGPGQYRPVTGGAAAGGPYRPAQPSGPPAYGAGSASGAVRLSAGQLGLREPLVKVQLTQFAIRAPASWRQTPSGPGEGTVTLSPPGGAGSFGVAYGLALGVARQGGNGIVDDASLQSASDALTRQLTQANGLTQTSPATMLQVGGQPATERDLRGSSPIVSAGAPEAEHDWLITVARPDGDLDYLIFVAPETDFPTLRPLFATMLQSFQPR